LHDEEIHPGLSVLGQEYGDEHRYVTNYDQREQDAEERQLLRLAREKNNIVIIEGIVQISFV
jgi:hypothetical protein